MNSEGAQLVAEGQTVHARVGEVNVTESVVQLLREEILTGALSGGLPVREQDVAERLGVSRTPVREAVGRLVAEGLLVKHGNRTAHVFRPSLAELVEIYEIRIPLESLAARLACEAADASFVKDLERASKTLDRAKSTMEWSVAHEAFHLRVIRGSRRPRLEMLVRTLRVQSEPYVRLAISDGRFHLKAQHDHAEIIRLVKEGNARSLERMIKAHLSATVKQVSTVLGRHEELR